MKLRSITIDLVILQLFYCFDGRKFLVALMSVYAVVSMSSLPFNSHGTKMVQKSFLVLFSWKKMKYVNDFRLALFLGFNFRRDISQYTSKIGKRS